MRNLLYIGNKLSSKNKTVTTIETLGYNLERLGYNLTYASSKKNKIFRLIDMILAVISNSRKTDYVLIDTYSTFNFYYALIISQLCRIFRLKYLPILHGGNLPERLKNNPKLSQLIFKYAYKNIAPSDYTKQVFEDKGFTKIEVIPNSISLENYPIITKNYDDINLLWVRSFSKLYNPELAVLILKKLKNMGHKTSLCMVGPDNDGSLFTTKALVESTDLEVTFTGKLEKKEWVKLSKDYNYFINTTNFDNLPVSVIEALALGFPIISTNVGGLPFLIQSNVNGVLVKPNDIKAFVNAILRLHKNENIRTQLIQEAITSSKQYDWENVKYKWLTLLN